MHRCRSFRAIGSATLLVAATVSRGARAQNLIFDVADPSPDSDACGVVGVGDWDGDGVDDFAIGAPFDDGAGTDAGVVRIYSGKDASVLATLPGQTAGDWFGGLSVRIHDLDGDGKDDLGVLASTASYAGRGSIYLIAGGTGAQLLRIDCPVGHAEFDNFGPLGDVDGDGVGDLFVKIGGWYDEVSIRSGFDGHEIALFTASNELFGYAVAALDDLDADGVRELLVGAPYHEDANHNTVGAAYVISTATGTVLRTHLGQFDGEDLGGGVGALDDLDRDGVGDYAVGGRQDAASLSNKITVYSGASGATLATILPPVKEMPLIGGQIADVGDLNGDGVGDWSTNGYWTDPQGYFKSAIFLVSGRTFLPLDHLEFDVEYAGFAPRLGDLDGDGLFDLAVGSVTSSWTNADVRVYAGDDLWLDAIPTHPVAGASLRLATREGIPGALELLVLEAVDGVATFAVVSGPALFDATGGVAFTTKLPSGLAGHDFTLRAYAKGALGHTIQSAPQTVSCR